jgi:ribonucleoside-diphosphate reductase alpha chain
MRDQIKEGEGSVQHIASIPEELRVLYRTSWELPQRNLIDMAAARSPYIDQSASLNLFMKTPTINKLSSMYAYAWRKGIKTTYYLRSRPATRIAKTTVSGESAASSQQKGRLSPEELACSLENPESCESCQ